MRRSLLVMGTVMFLAVAAAFSNPRALLTDSEIQQDERSPQSAAPLNNDASTFQFAIVSGRTGGHRARVFSQAVEQLNLLQPEFVVSVGDLIEGYSEDAPRLVGEWREFQTYAHQLKMPFFYLPGNHDVANDFQDKLWKEKFGRRYYHFVYKNVLFLMLNSEDPGGKKAPGKFSAEQIAYFKNVLAENKDVRWTLMYLHRPIWNNKNVEKTGWPAIEQALQGRRFTVFCGHEHIYAREIRGSSKFYTFATTGGSSKLRGTPFGEFDHIVWVTMKADGPILANLMQEGIFPEDVTVAAPGR